MKMKIEGIEWKWCDKEMIEAMKNDMNMKKNKKIN